MQNTDRAPFAELVGTVYDFYNRKVSRMDLEIWWEALKGFDFAPVRQAFSLHLVNTDAGAFVPKPADIVRMLAGGTKDAALLAWSKVDKAVRGIGAWQSVAFDDPIIHRVIDEMGGWVQLCGTKERDYPFKSQEFVGRYRAYRSRNEVPDHPPVLIGVADGENISHGYYSEPRELVLVGDPDHAQRVIAGGKASARLLMTPAKLDVKKLLKASA